MERLSLREFIEKREAEIKQLMSSLKEELRELRAARIAISEPQSVGRSPSESASNQSGQTPTIKTMAIEVLQSHGRSGTAEEIISWIHTDFEKNIERSSLSPQLSRLKSEGKIALDLSSGRWILPSDFSDEVRDARRLDNGTERPETRETNNDEKESI